MANRKPLPLLTRTEPLAANNNSDLFREMGRVATAVDQQFDTLLSVPDDARRDLYEAMRHAAIGGGKRLRPLLVMATAGLFNVDESCAIRAATAVEALHVYSLIHDDLPCMDDDDLRRGKPTLHKVYGEGAALLAGDYLLTFAFEVITNSPHLSPNQKLEIIQVISHCSGIFGMIGGQIIDIESEKKIIDERTLLKMHEGKTAALMIACLQVGYIASTKTTDPSESFLLKSIGTELGLAYQLQDDLFNTTSTTAVLGKQAGSDAAREKSTAISVWGCEKTEQKLKELEQSIFTKIQKLSLVGSELTTLIQNIFQRNY